MNRRSERGAMIIMVAVCLLGLTIFSAIAIDYGVLWTSRGQAQNSADAGALAAGWYLFDNPTDFDGSKTAARRIANLNPIWNEAPGDANILVTSPLTCPALTGGGTCAKVDVLRGATDVNGGTHSNVLPTMFANLVGIHSQAIQATATVQLAAANATGCMRPWFMIDKYTDTNGNGVYDAGDTYTSPGYQLPRDIGTLVDFHFNASPSGYGQVDVGAGGNDIENAIERCVGNGSSYTIGQTVPTKPGATNGPEKQGIDQLLTWDPNPAHFDTSTQSVQQSCANTSGGCTCGNGPCPNGPFTSPRVVIVALCDPNQADCAAGGQSNGNITITNFLSFWILGRSGNGNDLVINAELMGAAGTIDTGGGTAPSAFLKVVRLVR